MTRLGAVIFDMDGVLADTEPVHEEALRDFLAMRGGALTTADHDALVGLNSNDVWAKLIHQFGLHETIEECQVGHQPILVSRLVGLHASPGVESLISQLRAGGIPMAVASSSSRPVVEATLASLALRGAFGAVVSGEDVTRGKPQPDIYLRAADLLGVAPGRCVAIEDSPHGVQAALRAGMACLGLATRYATAEQLGATRTIRSLAEVGMLDLAALLG